MELIKQIEKEVSREDGDFKQSEFSELSMANKDLMKANLNSITEKVAKKPKPRRLRIG